MSDTRNDARSMLGNVLLAALWGLFAYAHFRSLSDAFRISVALMLLKECCDVGFFLLRHGPRDYSRSPYDWVVAFGGTFASLLLRPTADAQDPVLGPILMSVGLVLSVGGMLSLNRSLGIVPANRGIQTGGLYRIVRHPLYMAYTITSVGYLVSHPSLQNGLIVAAQFLCQVLRIYNEERFLSRDPAYVEFAKRTRWQLVPYVF